MRYSLRNKLALSYVFISLISVALISFLTNSILEKQFRSYVEQNQEEKNKVLVSSVAKQFQMDLNYEIKYLIRRKTHIKQGILVQTKMQEMTGTLEEMERA